MGIELTDIEIRILGVLIEKEMATPDYYPLTLNALINACNQKSNRYPVMSLDTGDIEPAMRNLRDQHLVWQIMKHGSRTAKYEHNLVEYGNFQKRELSVLCELFLRGPQTAGELNTRTARLIESHGLNGIVLTLKRLEENEKGPFVVKLPRRAGHKESRYMHLFTDVSVSDEYSDAAEENRSTIIRTSANDRYESLEEKVKDLQQELKDLKDEFLEFKRQFE